MGIFEEVKVKDVPSDPGDRIGSGLIALGYPEEVPEAPKRKENETTVEDCK